MRFRGGQTTSLVVAIPPEAWQVRQTHPDILAELDRFLDTHTDAQTADALNAAGHRSCEGKPFTAGIVLEARRSNNLPSHAERLRAKGLLTKTELDTRFGVHESTAKSWTKAGILNSHKANDKNERLYEPPAPRDPLLTARQGSPFRNEFPSNPRQEVHYEAEPLSSGLATRAGSVAKRRACLYSSHPTVNRGLITSAWATISFMSSGTSTLNTPLICGSRLSRPRLAGRRVRRRSHRVG